MFSRVLRISAFLPTPLHEITSISRTKIQHDLPITMTDSIPPEQDHMSTDFESLKARLLNTSKKPEVLSTPGKRDHLSNTVNDRQDDRPSHPILKKTMSEPTPQPPAMAETPVNARSFADTGGDTQMNDSQIYKQFRTVDTPARPPSAVQETPLLRSEDENTQYEYGMDSMGARNSLNLAGEMLSQQSPIQEETQSHDVVPTSPETQFLHGPARPFPGLATPQLAGHKRSSDGQMVSSAMRDAQTPALAAAFGGMNTPAIGPTQLFQQTQAQSSPPDTTRSDPIMTRPSPNMEDFVPFRSDFGTSPVILRQSVPSTVSELRQYTTVDESQERRRKLQELGQYRILDGDDDVGETRSQMLRTRSAQAMKAVKSVTAPSRPLTATPEVREKHRRKSSHVHEEKETALVDLVEEENEPIEIDEGEETQDEENADAMDHVDDHGEIAGGDINEPIEINTGDDEYDELGSAVRNTQPELDNFHPQEAEDDHNIVREDERIANSAEAAHTSNVNPSSKPTVIPGSQDVVQASQHTEAESTSSSQRIQGTSEPTDHDRETMASSPPNLPALPSNRLSGSAGHISDQAAQKLTASQRMSKGIPDSEAYASSPAVQAAAKDHDDSLSTRIYSTARSHVSPLRSNGQSLRAALPTQESVATPLKNAGARSHNDIIRGMLQQEESLDFDEIMGDVYTEEDRQHQKVLASPSAGHGRKKRKVSQPVTNATSHAAKILSGQKQQDQPAHNQDVDMVDDDHPAHVLATPRSANGQIDKDINERQHDNPDSAPQREAAGSAAVEDLVAFRNTAVSPSTKLSGPGRRTYGRKDRKISKKGGAAKQSNQQKSAQVPTHESEAVQEADVGPDIQHEEQVASSHHSATSRSAQVKAPKRVFALAKGTYQAYYPATVTSKFYEGDQDVAVEYDDGSTLTINATDALPLHLEIGDVVQIKFAKTKESNWIIRAFGDTIDDASAGVDIHGHNTIKVEAKSAQRKSMLGSTSQSSLREANISDIFLRRAQSTFVAARRTDPPLFQDQLIQNKEAAVVKFSSVPTTPVLQSRRSRVISDAKYSSPHVPEVKKSIKVNGNAFENMAFAVSFDNDHESAKRVIIREIEENGGIVLEHGFDELFVSNALYDDHADKKHFTPELRIKPECTSLGFVALISDRHSRRPKYLQALALGLPTLSHRWITDTLSKHQNEEDSTQDWSRYLLPAGHSAYLNAIRSRTLHYYNASEAGFASIIQQRAQPFNGYKLLSVAKKGKTNEVREKQRIYSFLTLAMGAADVKSVADVSQAMILAKNDDTWHWIHIDGSLATASKTLFAGGRQQKSLGKRKRGGDVSEPLTSDMVVRKGDLALFGDEFVVQSLILGALVE
ncbi:hypothetical protein MRB53_038728 [Persea americana]|nr:hypothetical protein MRB53_038728 [Persea americana]